MSARTAFWAPVHRALQRIAIGGSGIPYGAAPSLDYLGIGIQDHRLPFNSRGSSAAQPGIVGWYGGAAPMVANFVPSAIATANIAALANVVNGTAMTLVAATGAGAVVLSAAAPASFQPSGAVVTAGVAIDALPTLSTFGNPSVGGFNTSFYNRATCVGRAVSITGVAGGAGGAFLVSGYDAYGYAQTATVTVAAGANTVNSTKTFKVITSVTPQFTDAHNYSVGTADIYGFGLVATDWGSVDVTWNNTSITANTGFVAADTTSPATATTGDVRGTYAVQSASDGVKRLALFVTPSLPSLATNPTTGLFGVTPA